MIDEAVRAVLIKIMASEKAAAAAAVKKVADLDMPRRRRAHNIPVVL